MKINQIFFIIFFLPIILIGQTNQSKLEGKVTYTTSKNVYVRFTSTENISIGDTLLIEIEGLLTPALVVKQKSSISCVTENISNVLITKDLIVLFTNKITIEKIEPIIISTDPIITNQIPIEIDELIDSDTIKEKIRKQIINGRLTLSTNASINSGTSKNFQRIRTAFSMNVQNINNSAFSAQTYITYRHRYGIDQTNSSFYNDFKIFTLAVQYQPNEKLTIFGGRKMNNNLANMGAIDGIQAEYNMRKYTIGSFIGTRPDFSDYTFNTQLPQFGAYIVRTDRSENGGISQTTLAVAEQQNNFKTDRRFAYFQHNNSLVQNLNLFISAEMDMFKKVNDTVSQKLSLTSIYASLRYRMFKNLSFTVSYDNRRNIIFYESYQTFIDQLLAQETRQGFRLQVNYSPFKNINFNASTFFRYQGSNPNPTKNYIGNINFNRLPGINSRLTLSANFLESYYFKGTILGGRINNSFVKGKMSLELNYRNINYTFFNNESSLKQHVGGANISVNLSKLSSFMLSYEATIDSFNTYHRYFVTFVQRFKN